MRLVADWEKAWRWFSIQALALVALLPVVWPSLPPQVTGWVPEEWRPWVVVVIAIGGIAGRLVDQNKASA